MTDRQDTTVRGLRDGGAELAVVLTLGWDDVAALGREASRLAEQRGAPVSLDEAASHRLRTWSSVAGGPEARGRAVGPAPSPVPAAAPSPVPATAPERARPHAAHLGETAPVTPLSPHTAQRAPGRTAAAAGGGSPA
ncbi:hypothetical protein AB0H29_14060 [Streptomyces thermolilacinus]